MLNIHGNSFHSVSVQTNDSKFPLSSNVVTQYRSSLEWVEKSLREVVVQLGQCGLFGCRDFFLSDFFIAYIDFFLSYFFIAFMFFVLSYFFTAYSDFFLSYFFLSDFFIAYLFLFRDFFLHWHFFLRVGRFWVWRVGRFWLLRLRLLLSSFSSGNRNELFFKHCINFVRHFC